MLFLQSGVNTKSDCTLHFRLNSRFATARETSASICPCAVGEPLVHSLFLSISRLLCSLFAHCVDFETGAMINEPPVVGVGEMNRELTLKLVPRPLLSLSHD